MTTLVVAGALLAGCSGATGAPADQDGSAAGSDNPTVSTTTTPAGIPDGTWARQITTDEVTRRGLTLTPQETTTNYLDDGSVQLVLKTQGERWSILVQDDAGDFEVGDLGTSSYDALGRWVQTSDSTGDALLLDWDVEGTSLTTSELTTQDGQPVGDDGADLFLQGTWQRQG